MLKMYPKHVIGMIYSRIKPQSLDPYAKEKVSALHQKMSKWIYKLYAWSYDSRFDLLNFIKWLGADADHSDWSARVERFQSLYYRLKSRNSFQI